MAEEERNEPSVARALLNTPFVGSLARGIHSIALPSGLHISRGSIKPFKSEEEVKSYINKNTQIQNNLRASYPEIQEMKRLRSIEEERNALFLKKITEDRISNLSLARYIERKKYDLEYAEGPAIGLNLAPNNNVTNVSFFVDTLRTYFIQKRFLTEQDIFTADSVNNILEQHKNQDVWTEGTGYTGNPYRRRAQLLLTHPEVLLLIILIEMTLPIGPTGKPIEFLRKNHFMKEVQKRISEFKEGSVKYRERVSQIAVNLDPNKILQYWKQTNRFRVRKLNWSRLFMEHEGDEVTPQHIASFPDMDPKGTFHHGLYFSNDIMIEQLVNKDERGRYFLGILGTWDYFITMKTMYDFLKWCRSQTSRMYIIPYSNPYPKSVLRQRALWTLGKFPFYTASDENCESVPSWVFENNIGRPGICVPNYIGAEKWAGRRIFFSTIMKGTYNPLTGPILGGKRNTKTRKTRPKQRSTRRIRNLNA